MNPIQHILMAVKLYTRVPVPFKLNWQEDSLNKATAYYPLVGIFLGLHLCAVYWLAQQVFNPSLSILITFAISHLMTGGYNEGGFASYCDGIGGGESRLEKLRVMNNPHIGTFGALGLMALFLLRWQAFASIPYSFQYLALLLGLTWSRWASTLIMITLPFLRDETASKIFVKGFKISQFFIGTFFAWVLLIIPAYKEQYQLVVPLGVLIVGALAMRTHMKLKVGGYNSNSLGAAHQVAEVCYYLGIAALWKFI